jgi:hypothetical protein
MLLNSDHFLERAKGMNRGKPGNLSPTTLDQNLSSPSLWKTAGMTFNLLMLVLSLWLAGCAPSPMLKYGDETPAAALVPISFAGISDERARFREIFCAIQGRGEGFESLSRKERLLWLSRNKLPVSVRYYSLAAFADCDGISSLLLPSYDKLSLVDPRNDSLIAFSDALIPGGTLLVSDR